jgi:hypothetical protein
MMFHIFGENFRRMYELVQLLCKNCVKRIRKSLTHRQNRVYTHQISKNLPICNLRCMMYVLETGQKNKTINELFSCFFPMFIIVYQIVINIARYSTLRIQIQLMPTNYILKLSAWYFNVSEYIRETGGCFVHFF